MADDLPSIPKLREPVYPETHERKYLTPKQKVALVKIQEGCCAICREKPRVFEYDHRVELWAGGTNAFANWQALCRKCHTDKSGAEAKHRAKMNRLRGKAGQRARREKNGPQIKSRPFMSLDPRGAANFGGLKKHPKLVRGFDGKVRERT